MTINFDSPAHDRLLAEDPAQRQGVMTPLPGDLFLWRASCAEQPVLLYPTSVLNDIAKEAARMQWAERKAGMKAIDEVAELRTKCEQLEVKNEQIRKVSEGRWSEIVTLRRAAVESAGTLRDMQHKINLLKARLAKGRGRKRRTTHPKGEQHENQR